MNPSPDAPMIAQLKADVLLLEAQLKRVRKKAASAVAAERVARLNGGPQHLAPAADALKEHILETLRRVEEDEITMMDARRQIEFNFEEYRKIVGMPFSRDDTTGDIRAS